LVAVVQNFNKPGTDWAQGNFGGVASTEMNDLAIVFQNFNKTLSPPAASSAVQNGGSTLLTTGGGSTPLATVTTIPLAQSASVQVQPKPSPAVASRGYQIPTLPPAAAPLSDPEAEILQSGEATQTILAN